MLDAFAAVLVANDDKASLEDELTREFKKLGSAQEITKVASEIAAVTKNAYCEPGDYKWLKQYEGSPLYQQALDLEEQGLNLEAEKIKSRLERKQEDDWYNKEDMIRLKKKMLDLELAKARSAGAVQKSDDDDDEDDEEEENAVSSEPVAEKAASAAKAAVSASQPVAPKTASINYVDLAGRSLAHALYKQAQEASVPAAAPTVPPGMNPLRARELLSPSIYNAAQSLPQYSAADPTDYSAAGALAADDAAAYQGALQLKADYAAKHPVLNKLKGAALPGLMMGAAGGLAGHAIGTGAGRGLLGAGIGAGIGALGGGALGALMTPGAKERGAQAEEIQRAVQSLGPEDYVRAVRSAHMDDLGEFGHERALDVARASAPITSQTVNVGRDEDKYAAAVRVGIRPFAEGLQKEAIPAVGTMLGGAAKQVGTSLLGDKITNTLGGAAKWLDPTKLPRTAIGTAVQGASKLTPGPVGKLTGAVGKFITPS